MKSARLSRYYSAGVRKELSGPARRFSWSEFHPHSTDLPRKPLGCLGGYGSRFEPLNWSRRDSHPHFTRSELVASILGYAGEGKSKKEELRITKKRRDILTFLLPTSQSGGINGIQARTAAFTKPNAGLDHDLHFGSFGVSGKPPIQPWYFHLNLGNKKPCYLQVEQGVSRKFYSNILNYLHTSWR